MTMRENDFCTRLKFLCPSKLRLPTKITSNPCVGQAVQRFYQNHNYLLFIIYIIIYLLDYTILIELCSQCGTVYFWAVNGFFLVFIHHFSRINFFQLNPPCPCCRLQQNQQQGPGNKQSKHLKFYMGCIISSGFCTCNYASTGSVLVWFHSICFDQDDCSVTVLYCYCHGGRPDQYNRTGIPLQLNRELIVTGDLNTKTPVQACSNSQFTHKSFHSNDISHKIFEYYITYLLLF